MKKIIFTILLLSNLSFAMPFITLSGSALSGISSYSQRSQDTNNSQFESAANLNIDLDFSEKLSSSIVLGLGTMESESGFTQKADFQAFNIKYTPGNFNTSYAIGIVTVPFGQFSEFQSYNASMSTPFLINDLGYSQLAGNENILDLYGGGILTQSKLPGQWGSFDASIVNGIMSDNTNSDNGFGFVARYKNNNFKDIFNFSSNESMDDITLGISYLSDNTPNNLTGGLNKTAYMIDGKTTVNNIEFGGYYMNLNLNDGDQSTKDEFNVLMGYVSTALDQFILGFRASSIMPVDQPNGSTTVSSSFDPDFIGNFNSSTGNTDIVRYQGSLGIILEDNFKIHNEIIMDSYSDSDNDVFSVLSYASFTF